MWGAQWGAAEDNSHIPVNISEQYHTEVIQQALHRAAREQKRATVKYRKM